jgi:hypothetical protein
MDNHSTSPRQRNLPRLADWPLPSAKLPAILWCVITLALALWVRPFDRGATGGHLLIAAMLAAGGIVPLAISLWPRATRRRGWTAITVGMLYVCWCFLMFDALVFWGE